MTAPFELSANHVGLTVTDLSRSIAFYRDLLGFHVAYERGEVTAEYMPRLVGIPGARLKIAGLDIPGLHLDAIDRNRQLAAAPHLAGEEAVEDHAQVQLELLGELQQA